MGSIGTATNTAAQETEDEQTQVTRNVVLQEQGEPWTGNYTGQFMIVAYRPEEQNAIPSAVGDCEMDWGVNEAVQYNGILVDRIRDDPQRREVEMYVDGTGSEIERGTPFIINRTDNCTSEFIRLTLEEVPPDRGTEVTGSGPTVEGEANGNETGSDSGTGMPGFGALVAGTGITGGVALRVFQSERSDK